MVKIAVQSPKLADSLAGIGHNSGEVDDTKKAAAVDRLRNIVERIERLEEEKKTLSSDIKDIFQEAKSAGFDSKVLRQLIAIRRRDAADVEEEAATLDVYMRALGM